MITCVNYQKQFSITLISKYGILPNKHTFCIHFSEFTYEPWHMISNNVAFIKVEIQTSLCSLLLSL